MVALAALGAVLVPVSTHFREEDLRYVLEHSGATVLLLSERFRNNRYLEMVLAQCGQLPGLRDIVCFDDVVAAGVRRYCDLLGDRSQRLEHADTPPGTLGSIQYTSGTTGRPKGASLSFDGMTLNAALTANRLGLRAFHRCTSIIPLFHCAGCMMNLTGCLYVGAAYVGVSGFDPEDMFRIIVSSPRSRPACRDSQA